MSSTPLTGGAEEVTIRRCFDLGPLISFVVRDQPGEAAATLLTGLEAYCGITPVFTINSSFFFANREKFAKILILISVERFIMFGDSLLTQTE